MNRLNGDNLILFSLLMFLASAIFNLIYDSRVRKLKKVVRTLETELTDVKMELNSVSILLSRANRRIETLNRRKPFKEIT